MRLVRALLAGLWLAVPMIVGPFAAAPAGALDAIVVPLDRRAIDLTRAVERRPGEGERIQVQTAPGADGIVRRIEVRARDPGSNPSWAVFALSNTTDEQIDRLLVAPHYRMVGSGLLSPDLGRTRVVSVTPSQGFRPERQENPQADIFLITLDPGATVTFVAELRSPYLPQLYLWEADAYEDTINALTLYQGIVIGVAGLLALFLSILFVVKGSLMFPAAAALGWTVLGYVGLDFGFWNKVFELAPDNERMWRAVAEATLAASLLVFLFAYLNLARWHVRYAHVTALWFAFLVGIVALAVIDPPLAAGVARTSLGAVVGVGVLVVAVLAIQGSDRAILVVPTWLLLVAWCGVAGVTVAGEIANDVVAPALLGGLVLIVMLIGFTVMQHAFASGSGAPAMLGDVERKALALTGAGDLIWDWDVTADRVHTSPEAEAQLGLRRGALEGPAARWLDVVHPADADRFRTTLDGLIEQRRGRLVQEFRLRTTEGHYFWFLLRARPVIGADGAVTRIVGTLADVTESRTAEERLLHDAVRDNLTGLPNRELFLDRLEGVLARRTADDGDPTVMVFDLDRFKQVNDAVGMAVGDTILLTIARRLGRLLQPNDTLARLGGDAFGLILCSEREAERITAFADTLRRALRAPIPFGDREIFLTASIGLTLTDAGTKPAPSDMLRDAEIAMYHAKRSGGDRIELFKPVMRSLGSARGVIEADLRRALEKGEIALHYQPIVRLEDRVVTGFETVLRWDHPRRGRLAARDFLPVAEDTGLVPSLGLYVMERAATQLAAWQALPGGAGLVLHVDLPARHLLRHDLLQDLRTILGRSQLAPGSLRLELSETLVMENPEYTAQIMGRLKDTGVGLALDGFGTGHSSLAYLPRFPFDAIRIDASFVRPDSRGRRPVLLRAMIAIGHDLGMEVVAEGIETDSDAIELYQLGCDLAQGTAFGGAMPPDQAQRLITGRGTERAA